MRVRSTAIAIAMLLLGAGAAHAQAPASQRRGPVSAEVLIVLASEEGPRRVDARLADVPALRQPPFNAYPSISLLSSPRIELTVGRPHELPLPNGRRMRIELREITSDGRFRLTVSINRPGQQDYLPEVGVVASPGDPFFIAGQSYRDGTLVIGFRLGQRRR